MAKTLLQYSCFYILPFLFGMCMCGLQDEEFLTVAHIGTTKLIGRGRVVPGITPQPGQSQEDLQHTQVFLFCERNLKDQKNGQNEVSVYMKENTTNLDQTQLLELFGKTNEKSQYWITFHIRGSEVMPESETITMYTVSVLDGGTTYPNVQFIHPPDFSVFGYMVGDQVRILGDDPNIIKSWKKSFEDTPPNMMIEDKSNGSTHIFTQYEVDIYVPIPSVSGGGYVFDIGLLRKDMIGIVDTQ